LPSGHFLAAVAAGFLLHNQDAMPGNPVGTWNRPKGRPQPAFSCAPWLFAIFLTGIKIATVILPQCLHVKVRIDMIFYVYAFSII
jgi:hypothetical protein